jgi:transcriptional regulator with XRE-family HTH domain
VDAVRVERASVVPGGTDHGGSTLRAVRGWKQQDLAAVAGLWSSTISDFELGKKSPQAQTLARLLGAFGLSGHWLDPLSLLLRALRTVMEAQGAPPAGEALAGMEAWAGQARQLLADLRTAGTAGTGA